MYQLMFETFNNEHLLLNRSIKEYPKLKDMHLISLICRLLLKDEQVINENEIFRVSIDDEIFFEIKKENNKIIVNEGLDREIFIQLNKEETGE